MAEITELLARARGGDASAIQALMPLVYNRLRELAHRQLAKEAGPRTLNTTALVHELYLDLLKRDTRHAVLPDRRGQNYACNAR